MSHNNKKQTNTILLETQNFIIRFPLENDLEDLLELYSDKLRSSTFNSDNCEDNFYYPTLERIIEVYKFWKESFIKGWFTRLCIIERKTRKVVGTLEVCKRVSADASNGCNILRIDLLEQFEKEKNLFEINEIILNNIEKFYGVKNTFTKIRSNQVERKKSFLKLGFREFDGKLIGRNNETYSDYWINF